MKVEAFCLDGTTGSGSGVILRSYAGGRLLATAWHVVDEDCLFTVEGDPVKVQAKDEDHDVALLWQQKPTALFPLRDADVYLGMEVVAVGFPLQRSVGDTTLQVTRGFLAAEYGEQYEITANIYYGNSGGPVFSMKGELVGLSVAMISESPPEFFASPAEYVFRLYVFRLAEVL